MIANILLVAAREYRQIAGMRSFWVTLLILPLALAMGPLASRLTRSDHIQRVMLIDDDGGTAQAIRDRLERDRQRDLLTAFSRYAQRYGLDRADPGALWARHDRLYDDAQVAAFVRGGGIAAAEAAVKPVRPAQAPDFDPPRADFTMVPTPSTVASADPATLDGLIPSLTRSTRSGDTEVKPIDYVVFVPKGFGTTTKTVRLWSSEQPSADFLQPLQAVLNRYLRATYLQSAGLSPAQASTSEALSPTIAISTPPPGGGRERMLVRSIVPLVTSYILLMSLLLSGSWMLQGLVEERSNKLLETVLACISPNELLYGKLVGAVSVGVTMVIVWAICAVGAAFATQGAIAEFLRPALAPLASPGIVLVMIYFFFAGYLMMAMILLAIGAMSDSMREAQSYLTPVLLVIAMPFSIVAQSVLSNSGGAAISVMTWIPIYTPFTVLARIGTGMPIWQIVGSGAVLAAFIAIEFLLLSRVFRASLLNAGQKPDLAAIGRLMRKTQP